MTQNEELKSMLKRSQKEYRNLSITFELVGCGGLILGLVLPQNNTTLLCAVSFALLTLGLGMISLSTTYRDLQKIVPESKEVSE